MQRQHCFHQPYGIDLVIDTAVQFLGQATISEVLVGELTIITAIDLFLQGGSCTFIARCTGAIAVPQVLDLGGPFSPLFLHPLPALTDQFAGEFSRHLQVHRQATGGRPVARFGTGQRRQMRGFVTKQPTQQLQIRHHFTTRGVVDTSGVALHGADAAEHGLSCCGSDVYLFSFQFAQAVLSFDFGNVSCGGSRVAHDRIGIADVDGDVGATVILGCQPMD